MAKEGNKVLRAIGFKPEKMKEVYKKIAEARPVTSSRRIIFERMIGTLTSVEKTRKAIEKIAERIRIRRAK